MIIVSNINIAVAIKGGGRPTLLLPHAKMLLVPRKFFFLSLSLSLSLSLLGILCSGSVQVSFLSRFILVGYSRILINPYICVKLQEVVIILNISRRGRSFIKKKQIIITGSLLAIFEFRINVYFNEIDKLLIGKPALAFFQ